MVSPALDPVPFRSESYWIPCPENLGHLNVTVGSGEYTAVLTREQAEDERVLLALEHEGAASPRRAGFPRLVGPSEWDCFLSVKSVDRIEVTLQPQQATAATIALARLER